MYICTELSSTRKLPVSSDVRLVADASQSDAVKLSAQSPGDGASHTRLTDSRRPNEAQNGALKFTHKYHLNKSLTHA